MYSLPPAPLETLSRVTSASLVGEVLPETIWAQVFLLGGFTFFPLVIGLFSYVFTLGTGAPASVLKELSV